MIGQCKVSVGATTQHSVCSGDWAVKKEFEHSDGVTTQFWGDYNANDFTRKNGLSNGDWAVLSICRSYKANHITRKSVCNGDWAVKILCRGYNANLGGLQRKTLYP